MADGRDPRDIERVFLDTPKYVLFERGDGGVFFRDKAQPYSSVAVSSCTWRRLDFKEQVPPGSIMLIAGHRPPYELSIAMLKVMNPAFDVRLKVWYTPLTHLFYFHNIDRYILLRKLQILEYSFEKIEDDFHLFIQEDHTIRGIHFNIHLE